jgi:hypothetical protein
MRRSARWVLLAVAAALLLAWRPTAAVGAPGRPPAGRGTGALTHGPAGAGAGPAPGLLHVTPPSGPPGSTVRLSGRTRGPGRPTMLRVCWIRCGPGGIVQRLPVVWNGRRFTLIAQVPAFVWRRDGDPAPLPAGHYPVRVACPPGTAAPCGGQTLRPGRFALVHPAPAMAWRDIGPAGPWAAIPPAQSTPGFGLSLGQRQAAVATCAGGLGTVPPHLLSSRDLGRTWTSIPLPVHELGDGPGGVIGCRAVLPDPVDPHTFYVAGRGDPETANLLFASPLPLYTTDSGRSWQLLPVPPGFTGQRGWAGFTSTATAVVSWYTGAYFANPLQPSMFAEEVALQGGASWVEVPLLCPHGSPCIWHLPGLNPAINDGPDLTGLVLSPDGGRTWRWASWAGMDLSGGQPAAFGNALLWPAAVAWTPAGAGIPGNGAVVPLLFSRDGGRNWTWVTLPPPPPGWAAAGSGTQPPNLRVLPDGALLLQVWGGHPAAWLLRPRAVAWCPLAGHVPGNGLFLTVGRDLVWLAGRRLAAETAQALRCAR